MTGQTRGRGWAFIAAVLAFIFLVAAISGRLYPVTLEIPHQVHQLFALLHPAGWQFLAPLRSALLDDGWTGGRVLRKAYSVLAFSLVGYFIARWRRRSPQDVAGSGFWLATIGVVAGFSAGIEVLQKVVGSQESLRSNLFDIACGALGGLLGASAVALETELRRHRQLRLRKGPGEHIP